MGSYWKKLAWIWVWRHVRLGLAPCPFGAGAAAAWDGRDHDPKPFVWTKSATDILEKIARGDER
jgi:hypothetical protein